MNNKGVFYGISALLGVLAAFHGFMIHVICLCLFSVFLLKRKQFAVTQMLLILFIFLAFFVRAEIETTHNKTSLTGKESTFYLWFAEMVKIDGDQLTGTAIEQRSSEKLLIKYKIHSEAEKKYLQHAITPGFVCKVSGKLDVPSPATNENSFDYQLYLQRNHIHWILKPAHLDLEAYQTKTTIFTFFNKIRAKGIHYLEVHFPPESVPLAAALLFGTSDLIAAETMDDYRELGIVHLLAISGLHIAIIVAIVYYLLLRCGLTRERSIDILLVCLPIYCMLTGASPSVNRSVLMTMLLLIGRKWGGGTGISRQ
jgi:competence protein ComEC